MTKYQLTTISLRTFGLIDGIESIIDYQSIDHLLTRYLGGID
jgi:hypothetical protein